MNTDMNNCQYPTRKTQHAPLEHCGKPATHEAVKFSRDGSRTCYCAEHNALVANRGGLKTKPLKEGA